MAGAVWPWERVPGTLCLRLERSSCTLVEQHRVRRASELEGLGLSLSLGGSLCLLPVFKIFSRRVSDLFFPVVPGMELQSLTSQVHQVCTGICTCSTTKPCPHPLAEFHLFDFWKEHWAGHLPQTLSALALWQTGCVTFEAFCLPCSPGPACGKHLLAE